MAHDDDQRHAFLIRAVIVIGIDGFFPYPGPIRRGPDGHTVPEWSTRDTPGRAAAGIAIIGQEEYFLNHIASVYFDTVIPRRAKKLLLLRLTSLFHILYLLASKRLVQSKAHEGKVPFGQFLRVFGRFAGDIRRPDRHEGYPFHAPIADGKDIHSVLFSGFHRSRNRRWHRYRAASNRECRIGAKALQWDTSNACHGR